MTECMPYLTHVSSIGNSSGSDREFGSRIEQLARERWHGRGGMRGLSAAVGISRPTLYAWFRGHSSPTAAMLGRLAAALDMTTPQLVEALEPLERTARQRVAAVGLSHGVAESGAIGYAMPRREVAWCDADDPIGPVAHRLYEEDFSQMPVRGRGAWLGLLTGEAIARWMAGRTARQLSVDERTPVREVLSYAGEPDNFRIVSAATSTREIIGLFHSGADSGHPLAAILVTDAGQPGDSLRGIITPYDLPRLLGASRGSPPG